MNPRLKLCLGGVQVSFLVSRDATSLCSSFFDELRAVEGKKAGTDNTITGPCITERQDHPALSRQAPGDFLGTYFVSRPADIAQRSVTAFSLLIGGGATDVYRRRRGTDAPSPQKAGL